MALEVVSSILVARPIYFLGCRQVVKAPDFDSGIRKFKSCHPSQKNNAPPIAFSLSPYVKENSRNAYNMAH